MKFNPPPNWPPPPAGWSPPPGWRPDPSWPRPPEGWPLWVDEERTFVLARPFGAAPPPQRQPRDRWYLRTTAVVVFLLFCFPVGVVLSWLRTDWSLRRRGAITAVVAVVVLILGATSSPPPAKTVQLSSPVGGVATLSAPTSAPTPSSGAAIPGSTSAKPSTSPAAATTTRPVSAAPTSHAAALPPAPTTATTTRPAAPPPPAPTTKAPPPKQPTQAPTSQRSTCGAPSNPYGYNFCGDGSYVTGPPGDICDYFDCIDNFWHGRGYMVECNDGTYSMSGGLRGACSDHGGEDQPVYSG